MKQYKIHFLQIICLVLMLSGICMGNCQTENKNFEIGKNLEIFVEVFKQVNANYVDDIDPGSFMKTGIDELLKSLDPYTVYIPESEIEDFRIATTGQYGGIGALIHPDGQYIVITDPYKNSPAKKAGLKAGDIVLSVNGKSTIGLSNEEINQLMKGVVGGTVHLKIQRYGESEPLNFSITREVINIESVGYTGKLSSDIGYIKFDAYTQNSASEVKNAIIKLRNDGKMKGLILDLRGNGGGLLSEAVDLVNLFVKAGQEVVSMKGQIPASNQTFKTQNPPFDTDIPLVVLVDEMSASSSEITCGALQDLDRAVIMGQRTYGKGLVQNVFPLIYHAQIKITVAKYYIPSGRCIQAVDYSHKNVDGKWVKVPDSLITKFQTAGGRTVYDGAGIEPDIITESDTLNEISQSLVTNHILFNFATQYYYNHSVIAPIDEFEIDDDIWNQFLKWIDEHQDKYQSADQLLLADLTSYYSKEKERSTQIKTTLLALQKQINDRKKEAVQENKVEICRLLKLEILARYYDYDQYIKFAVELDPEIEAAKTLLLNQKKYKSVLTQIPIRN